MTQNLPAGNDDRLIRAHEPAEPLSIANVAHPVVVVHQPHFLPWLGYYNKLANADILVFQDDVQFRRRYFQNRTLTRNPQGTSQWLVVPVHAKRTTLIRDVVVASCTWADKIRKSLRHSYGKAPYFRQYWEDIAGSFRNRDKYLVDINQLTLQATLAILELRIVLGRASSVAAEGSRTERVVAACKRFGARSYIFGEGGGRHCHSVTQFEQNGIATYQQQFRARFAAALRGHRATALNVSALEFIFEHGAAWTRNLIETCWRIKEDQ